MRALVLAIACVIGCRENAPDRQALFVRSLDDGGALVVSRDASGQHITRLSADARQQWSTPLQGDAASFYRTDDGVVIGGDRVLVQTYRRRPDRVSFDLQIEFLSMQDGSRTITPLGTAPHDGAMPMMPGYLVNDQLTESVGTARAYSLVTFDMRTGKELRRTDFPFEPMRAIVRANDVVVQDPMSHYTVSTTGAVRPLQGGLHGCIFDDRYWKLTKDESERYALVTEEAPARRVPLELRAADLHLEHCARYQDLLVMFLRVSLLDAMAQYVLAIFRDDGTMVGTVPIDTGGPPHALMTATLPRFVPLLRGVGARELLLIDLQEGRIAWQLAPSSEIFHGPFRAGDRWYVANGASQPELAVLDGATGKLITAKRLLAKGGVYPPKPNNIGEHGIFLHPGRWVAASEPLVAKLDPVTLAHVAGLPVQVLDVGRGSPFAGIPSD